MAMPISNPVFTPTYRPVIGAPIRTNDGTPAPEPSTAFIVFSIVMGVITLSIAGAVVWMVGRDVVSEWKSNRRRRVSRYGY